MTNLELGLTIALAIVVCAYALQDMRTHKRMKRLEGDYQAALKACQTIKKV